MTHPSTGDRPDSIAPHDVRNERHDFEHDSPDHRIAERGTVAHGTTEHHPAPQNTFEWDERYSSSEQIWSGQPNGNLIAQLTDLAPGRALDVGCGEGADAVWLAGQGWQVTGLDVSKVALERAERHAADLGAVVTWIASPLVGAPLPTGGFDLVSAQYPALRRTPDSVAERSLLAAVAPGGVLLVVHHADFDEEHAKAQGFDPADYVSPEDVANQLDSDWRVEVNDRRPREVAGGAGSHHVHDLVLRARRLR